MTQPGSWATITERGSIMLLKFVVWFQETLGRRFNPLVLYPTVLYFFLTSRSVRRASRQYLARLYESHGPLPRLTTPPRWWHPFVHIFEFSQNTLDRLCFWARRYDSFELCYEGRDLVMQHLEAGRGAILLGAHLGSFDVLRVLSEAADIVVNVVMFTDNARQINAVFKALDPDSDLRIIPIDPNSIRSAFQVKQCLDRGEFVAIPCDRTGFDGRGRVAWAPFLGKPAAFPQGPFLLASILRVPVLFTVALRVAPSSYRIIAEPFADGRAVPRSERDEAVQASVERFALCLERYCVQTPYQWFNFFDFWPSREPQGG